MIDWTHVLIHHTAIEDSDHAETDNIRRYHIDQRGWQDIGYHYLVEKFENDYQVIVGRPLNLQGAHSSGYNKKAIGVALMGDFTHRIPSNEMLHVVIRRVIRPMLVTFGIPVENVLGHRDVRKTQCPGDAFDMDHFRSLI